MVRQFINKNGKLVAGKVIKIHSATPKTSHPGDKGKTKNLVVFEPTITITNAANNELMVTWHSDYEDHYQAPNNLMDVCIKHKKDQSGNQYCSQHKSVPSPAVDKKSILKAVRYSSQ